MKLNDRGKVKRVHLTASPLPFNMKKAADDLARREDAREELLARFYNKLHPEPPPSLWKRLWNYLT